MAAPAIPPDIYNSSAARYSNFSPIYSRNVSVTITAGAGAGAGAGVDLGVLTLDDEQYEYTDSNASMQLRSAMLGIVGVGLTLITVFGNLLVLVAFALDKSIRTISNYFILSLAIADLTIGMISMPLYTVYLLMDSKWIFGRFMCKLWLSIDYTVSNASVGNLLVICCDRYFSITRPLTYRAGRTRRKAAIMIIIAWFISAILWTPWIFAWPAIEGEERVPEDDCYIQFLTSNSMQTQVITIITAICAFYAPVTLMCVLYMRVYHETRKRRKALGRLQACQRARGQHGRKSVTSANATTFEPSAMLDDGNTQLSTAFDSELRRRPSERLAKSNHLSLDENYVYAVDESRDSAAHGFPSTPRSNGNGLTPTNGRMAADRKSYHRSMTDPHSGRRPTIDSNNNNNNNHSSYVTGEPATKRYSVSVSRRSTLQSVGSIGLSLLDGSSRKPSVNRSKKASTAISDSPAYNSIPTVESAVDPDADADADADTSVFAVSHLAMRLDSADSGHELPRIASTDRRRRSSAATAAASAVSVNGSNAALLGQRSAAATRSPMQLLSTSTSSRLSAALTSGVNCSYASASTKQPLDTSRAGATLAPLSASASALDLGDTATVSRSSSMYNALTIGLGIGVVRKMSARRAESRQVNEKGDSKALRTLAAILLAFIITWSPYNLFTIMKLYCDCVASWLYILGYYLCYINSTINPLCYALCNTQFRRAFYKIMKCAYCKKKRRERSKIRLIVRR